MVCSLFLGWLGRIYQRIRMSGLESQGKKKNSRRSKLLTIIRPWSTLSSLLSCFDPFHLLNPYPSPSPSVLILSQFSVSIGCLPPETHFLPRKQASSQGLGESRFQQRGGHVYVAVPCFSFHQKVTADLNRTTHIRILGLNFPFSASSKFPLSASLRTSITYHQTPFKFSTSQHQAPHFSRWSIYWGKVWFSHLSWISELWAPHAELSKPIFAPATAGLVPQNRMWPQNWGKLHCPLPLQVQSSDGVTWWARTSLWTYSLCSNPF